MNIRKEGDKMTYTIDEQETHIWYDPKTKETVVETNYVHDINHYLRIIADGGMELLEHEVDGDRVISLRAKVVDGSYRIDRRAKKKRVVSDEMRERLRQQLARARKS
jgi:hypothetical protein